MPSVSDVSSVSIQPAGSDPYSDLTSDEFIKVIFAELTNQDPLAPNDTSAVLEQISSLRSIQSDIDLSKKLNALVTQNQLSSAGNLIGNFVGGLSEGGFRADGFVVSISRTAAGPVLNLDNGFRILFDNVDEIIDPSIFVSPPVEPPVDPVDPVEPVDEIVDDGGDQGDGEELTEDDGGDSL